MLKQISKLEIQIGERLYQLICESDSPLGELHDALSQMKGYVVQRIVDADKAMKEQPKEGENVGEQQQRQD